MIDSDRCGIYKLYRGPHRMFDYEVYTEAWDNAEDPLGPSEVPDGELVATFTGDTYMETRRKVDHYRDQNNLVMVGCRSMRRSD